MTDYTVHSNYIYTCYVCTSAYAYTICTHAHACTLHLQHYKHLYGYLYMHTHMTILTIKKCTNIIPPSLLRRFLKFLPWLIKKYKSDTKLAVEINIKMSGISRIFRSTLLIGDEVKRLYSFSCINIKIG